jgi:O-antigen/teichoic acid export membrane protein
MFAPLTLVFPLHFMIHALTIGANRIYPAALLDVAAKSLFLIPLFILYKAGDLALGEVIFLNLTTLLIAIIAVFIFLKPTFQNLQKHYETLRAKNRTFGWHFYIGAVTNQTTYRLDELFISLFINTTQLGFYTLASIICTPMAMLSKSFSSSMFKRFASSQRIPPKVFVYNFIWLVACVAGFYFLADLIVQFLFGGAFALVAEYVVLLSIAYFFQGAYQPYTFLYAKSMGKSLRNVAFAEAIVNVVGNIVLILIMGIYGVILASILARLVHFAGLTYYYRQYLKTQNS